MTDILNQHDPADLGSELRLAREKRGLTQKQAADVINVARTTLVAIEKGERRIKASELVQLLRAYGRDVSEFMQREQPRSAPFIPQFRSASRASTALPEIDAEILDEFESLCKDYVTLESIMGDPLPYRYPPEYGVSSERLEQRAEVIAMQERQRLGLGDGPLPVLRSLLEREVGLRIFYLPLKPSSIGGLYIYDEVIGGCIAMNTRHPPERRRWSLAHEFAHFLVHRYQVDLLEIEGYQRLPERERFADAFALHFLMPASGIGRQIGDKDISRADLFVLAHYFGVSVQAFTLRLEGLRYIPVGTWDSLQDSGLKVRQVQAHLDIDPVYDPADMLPDRYQILALNAFENGEISEGKLADYLRVSRSRAREMVDRFATSDQYDSSMTISSEEHHD